MSAPRDLITLDRERLLEELAESRAAWQAARERQDAHMVTIWQGVIDQQLTAYAELYLRRRPCGCAPDGTIADTQPPATSTTR